MTKVSQMSQRELRMIIRDENTRLIERNNKKLKDTFMTRGDCLKVHLQTGKPTNGSLGYSKAKFYGAMAGFIVVISTFIGLLIKVIADRLP